MNPQLTALAPPISLLYAYASRKSAEETVSHSPMLSVTVNWYNDLKDLVLLSIGMSRLDNSDVQYKERNNITEERKTCSIVYDRSFICFEVTKLHYTHIKSGSIQSFNVSNEPCRWAIIVEVTITKTNFKYCIMVIIDHLKAPRYKSLYTTVDSNIK